jgi:ribokinase
MNAAEHETGGFAARLPGGRPQIIVVGSINLDLVVRCPRLPLPGETIAGGDLARVAGGKGANQALAAARLGADVAMIGCVGDDSHGEQALAGLRTAGVDLSGVARGSVPTGTAMIVVADGGENQIVVSAGSNALVRPDGARLAAADAIICQLEIPDEAVSAAAAAARGLFCLNAAPVRPVPQDVLERVDLLVVNETEYAALDAPKGALVALTLGARGAVLLRDGAELAQAAAPAVEAVDTVGAGDTFCAALVVALLSGRSPENALAWACLAAAFAVTRPGAQDGMPTAEELLTWRIP